MLEWADVIAIDSDGMIYAYEGDCDWILSDYEEAGWVPKEASQKVRHIGHTFVPIGVTASKNCYFRRVNRDAE